MEGEYGGGILKSSKLNHSILALGIFILILASLTGVAAAAELNELGGAYGTGKVTADLLDKASIKEGSAITMADIMHLEDFCFKGLELAYASEDKTTITNGEDQVLAAVAGVSGSYRMFHQLELKSGSFLTPSNKKEMVAVVDEDLALELFNNTNVVGMYIELYGISFRIIGVVSGGGSIITVLTDDGIGTVYIPVEQMLELDADTGITSIEIKAADMGTTGININRMKEGLASMGKNSADYRMLDYNIEKRLTEEKAQVVTFISGIGVIIMLLSSIRKRLKGVYGIWKSSYKVNYLMDVFRQEGKKLGFLLAEAAALLAIAVIVWNAVKFDFYIPADYIPDELIDMKFYSDLIESLLQKNVQSIGHIPSMMEMKTDALRALQYWSLYMAILAGFPSYFMGLRLSKRRPDSRLRRMVFSSVFIGICTALSLLLLGLMKLPVEIDTEGLLVLAAFIMLSSSGFGQSVFGAMQGSEYKKE